MQESDRTRGGAVLRQLPSHRKAAGRKKAAGAGEDLPSLRPEHPAINGFKDARPHAWLVELEGCRPKNPLNGSQGRTVAGNIFRAKERRQLRQRAYLATLSKVPISQRRRERRLTIAIIRISPCKYDTDGWTAAAKPIRDGVADAFGLADNHPSLEWRYHQEKGGVKEYAVNIFIWETGP